MFMTFYELNLIISQQLARLDDGHLRKRYRKVETLGSSQLLLHRPRAVERGIWMGVVKLD